METIILSFIVIAVVFAGMAVGVLFKRPGIRGTCGGLNHLKGLGGACPACSGVCERKRRPHNAASI